MVPIHDASGRPVAVLGADVALNWLTSKLDETDSTYNEKSPLASRLMGLKRHSFIINYDGRFITHPEENRLLEGIFYKQLKADHDNALPMLIEQMKSGETSIDERQERFTTPLGLSDLGTSIVAERSLFLDKRQWCIGWCLRKS